MNIESITSKIMKTGINHYALKFETDPQNVQINVSYNESVIYKMCEKFQPKETVGFKDIMQKKIDIFQYEALSAPFMKKSLEQFANKNQYQISNVSAFIFLTKSDALAIAFYEKGTFRKQLLLSEHLQSMGI